MSGFEVKAMSFHVAIHFLNPHTDLIKAYQGFRARLVGKQIPWFFFAFFPQFVDPAKGNVIAQNMLLGAIFVGMAIVTELKPFSGSCI